MKLKRILILLFITIFWSCEEIIQVDINSSDPQIIIEAKLSNLIERNGIYITESTDFYNPNEYKKITDAAVTIFDDKGNSFIIEEISPGVYQHPNLVSIPNNIYTIDIHHKNKKYTASSSAPEPILLDSLSYELRPRPFQDKKFLELHVHFQDDESISNFARFVVYKNGEKINRIFIYDDRLTNGNEIDFFFFNFDEDEEFQSGDSITVELETINEQIHTYFRTLRRVAARSFGGPFGPAAPSNPISNWDNNAFGYFSAYSIDSKTIVIE